MQAKALVRPLLARFTSTKGTRRLFEPAFRLIGLRNCERAANLDSIRSVLVVRLDQIGDVVLTFPFLRELRRNLPQAAITLVVKPEIANLVEKCPYVDKVLTYDWNVGKPSEYWNNEKLSNRLPRHLRALKLAARHLWRQRFDLAILPRWDADCFYYGTLVTYLSGAPRRLSFSAKGNAEKLRLTGEDDTLFTDLVDSPPWKHEAQKNLDLVTYLGGVIEDTHIEAWTSLEDESFADEVLKSHGVEAGASLVCIAPGAREPKRVWPVSRFLAIAKWVAEEYGAKLLIAGGPGDKALGRKFQQELGAQVIDMTGRNTLRQTTALLKRCNLFVGNDTGTMHLAAAAGLPVVEVSCHPVNGAPEHANSPHRFHPWGVPYRVLQPEHALAPCVTGCEKEEPHCILGVTVEQVQQACMELSPVAPISYYAT